MNENPARSDEEKRPGVGSINFGVWMAMTLTGAAVVNAGLVALGGLILAIPARSLLVPYLALLDSFIVFFPLLYWALLARDRPKSYALRFGVATFAHSQCFLVALGFSAVWLHLLSLDEALNLLGTCAVPAAALVSGVSYVAARQMVKGPKSG